MNQQELTQHDRREVVSEPEAAEALGVSLPTLRRYRREGHPICAFFRPCPRRICYLMSDVEEARRKRRVPSSTDAQVESAAADLAAADVDDGR